MRYGSVAKTNVSSDVAHTVLARKSHPDIVYDVGYYLAANRSAMAHISSQQYMVILRHPVELPSLYYL